MLQFLGNKDDSTIIRIAAYAALVIPFFIMTLKFIGTMVSGSLSMQAALIDSISDIISSVFVIASVHISQKPENEDYQFGYGKVQPLGALVQAIFIFASGVFFIIEAYQNISYSQEIRHTGLAIVLILISLISLIILTNLQKYVINKTDSLIIKSSFLHFHMDVFIDIAVLLSILLGHYFNIFFIDSVFGIIFTIYILTNACRLVKRAFDELIDKSFSKQDMEVLRQVLSNYNEVTVDTILTRQAGGKKFINLRLLIDEKWKFSEVYAVTEAIKIDLSNHFKSVMTHVEVVALKS